MNSKNYIQNFKILYTTLSYMHVILGISMLTFGYLNVTQAISIF